eukprot:TRINITY_DN6228_c0_g1_i1.p1 TRINITY_DN6228_c0_g1~~TRINITY_DN6228_c0_g1_i1.p1  ORF type:complete len:1617 (-),score=366.29 TRINITY_DN6228_c0_g1_i1:13-4497(-)
MPRWDFKKFDRVSANLVDSVFPHSVGEVLAFGHTFAEALQKAIRMCDTEFSGFDPEVVPASDEGLRDESYQRVFVLASALAAGRQIDEIHELSGVSMWFLSCLSKLLDVRADLKKHSAATLPAALLLHAKLTGFSDKQIGALIQTTELGVRQLREEHKISPHARSVDGAAGLHFPLQLESVLTYMTYHGDSDDFLLDTQKEHSIIVLGSGVYRIGSSAEFDWSVVSCARTLRALGHTAVVVNHNPESVSSEPAQSSRFYCEELSVERVLDIYAREQAKGVVTAFGGPRPSRIAQSLSRQGVEILGTSTDSIDDSLNRFHFSRLLDRLGVDQPKWKNVSNVTDALSCAASFGYPVLLRDLAAVAAARTTIAHSATDVATYFSASSIEAVVVSKFIVGAKELGVAGVGQNGRVVVQVCCEHVENAGVNSGDATIIVPAQDLDPVTVQRVEDATQKIAAAYNVSGPFHLQFIAKDSEIKVIECQLRSTRLFPFVSKTIGVDLVDVASRVMVGAELPDASVLQGPVPHVGVRVAQFSFTALEGADPALGLEMASTGEVACFGESKYQAYLKAMLATEFRVPSKNVLLSIGSFKHKAEFLESARKLHELGLKLYGTSGTADYLSEHGVPTTALEWHREVAPPKTPVKGRGKSAPGTPDVRAAAGSPAPLAGETEDFMAENVAGGSVLELIARNQIDLIINISSVWKDRPSSFTTRGYATRRVAIERDIPLLTDIKCAKLLVEALYRYRALLSGTPLQISPLDMHTSHRLASVPAFVTFAPLPDCASEAAAETKWRALSVAALASGCSSLVLLPSAQAPLQTPEQLVAAKRLGEAHSLVDFALVAGPATGLSASAVIELCNAVPVAGLLLGESSGDVTSTMALFEAWPETAGPIIAAASAALPTHLLLADLFRRHVHVVGVSTRSEVALLRTARLRGVPVTFSASVSTLAEADSRKQDSAHGAGIWDAVDLLDIITADLTASDAEFCDSLTMLLPLGLRLVREGRLAFSDFTARLSTRPRELLRLPTHPSTAELNLDMPWQPPAEPNQDAGTQIGILRLQGQASRIVVRGKIVFLDRRVLSAKAHTALALVPVSGAAQLKPSSSGMQSAASAFDSATPKPTSTPAQPTAAVATQPAAQTQSAGVSAGPVQVASAPTSRSSVLDLQPKFVSNVVSDTARMSVPFDLQTPERTRLSIVGRDILTVRQFDRDTLHYLFGQAHEMRKMVDRVGHFELLKGKVMAALFYEPSTRTSSSFIGAMQRLGGSVIPITSVKDSSVAKGETLADTIRTMEQYSDVIVLRHPAKGAAEEAAKASRKPVINAGDGVGEHPTQALLDAFTIREEMGSINNLTITMVGDLKHGRTVHSLATLLSKYGVTFNFVAPKSLAMPKEILDMVRENGAPFTELEVLDDVLPATDVLYVTRVQKERFASEEDYMAVKGLYCITAHTLTRAKEKMIVMHPLPRVDEIAPEVDSDPRAAYFRQMQYGMYVRMALLAMVLGKA